MPEGLTVMPGFIDVPPTPIPPFMMSRRLREQAPDLPSVKGNWNYLLQGVTTVITGNCGEGFADMDQWFDFLEKLKFGTNVFHLAPHGQSGPPCLERISPASPQPLNWKI